MDPGHIQKKSFNLNLKSDVSIFENELSHKFCLLANSSDDTSIKNHVCFDIARYNNISDVVNDIHVDLYINGSYQGLYTLCSEHDTTDEFLIEYDFRKRESTDSNIYLTNNNNGIEISSKSNNNISDILNLYNVYENNMFKGKLPTFFDIDSVAKIYLLNEFSGNLDGGIGSLFYSSNGTSLKMCCPWDFDTSFGCYYPRFQYNVSNSQIIWVAYNHNPAYASLPPATSYGPFYYLLKNNIFLQRHRIIF